MERILVGDNPFLGVDHLAQERTRTRGVQSTPAAIARVVEAALESGAEGLVCSVHPVTRAYLTSMKELGRGKKFGVYLIIPDAQYYVRLASERGMVGVLNEFLAKQNLAGKFRTMLGGGSSLLMSDPARVLRTYLSAEVGAFRRVIPGGANINGVLLHELLTELIVSFKLADFAAEYVEYSKNDLGTKPGFVTRNFPRFVQFLMSSRIRESDVIIMSPFNSAGFQMNPSRGACEESLSQLGEADVVAMSVLAGGHISVDDAIRYLRGLPRSVSCVVGVSTKEHAIETFSKLKQGLAS